MKRIGEIKIEEGGPMDGWGIVYQQMPRAKPSLWQLIKLIVGAVTRFQTEPK